MIHNSQHDAVETPLMRQYFAIKQEHHDTLLLFQVGDFYELFFEDAQTAAAFLGITLTTRGKHKGEAIPLCGVPVHALDHYLAKLLRGGFRVALCDQLSEPVPGKVVERGVTQVLTPGTLTDLKLLDAKSASYLLAFYPTQTAWGLVFGELLTAQLFATVIPVGTDRILESELSRFFPDEIVLPNTPHCKEFNRLFKRLDYFVSHIEIRDQIVRDSALWIEQFRPAIGTYTQHQEALHCALQTFYAYMHKTHQTSIGQFSALQLYRPDDFLVLDAATQRNLELVHNSKDRSNQHTLFWALDNALTPMGSRLIKKWIVRPLVTREAIEQRQHVVRLFIQEVLLNQQCAHALHGIGDLERIIGRIALNKARLQDYQSLAHALAFIPTIKQLLTTHIALPLIAIIHAHLDDFSALHHTLISSLNDDANHEVLIRPGFDQQLDYLRDLAHNGQTKILSLEQREQQSTGIGSLKIRYNQVHGYYIEVTKTHSHDVPAHYVRSQTLVGRERFTTPELQHLQQQLVYAQAEANSLEKIIFERIKQEVARHVAQLRKLAYALTHIDALLGFARVAVNERYVCPTFNNRQTVSIGQGRHPIVERTLDHPFIPNDTLLDSTQSLLVITGPNMGGKSTYLRQVALMSIMAQCGSFVPAGNASLPLFDRIFTRIGSGDNLAQGKSTFLVEMEETATICTQATDKSLVILDEVGRGTSTFDGLAIAQAVIEYLYTVIKAPCLFATHYHELTTLAQQFPGIANYHTASTKTNKGIVLLHKIIAGKADGSFGLEVAKKTEMPESVVRRAQELMQEFTQYEVNSPEPSCQTSLYLLEEKMRTLQDKVRILDTALKPIAQLSCDDLTPRQALQLLCSIQETLSSTQ